MPQLSPKVLLADDDSAMLRLLSKWLESAGYNVQRAVDGAQAAAMIEQDCPQVLVTDWEMPHMDGLELVRWVRAQNLPNYVYIIFLTVRSGLDDMIRGLDAGADDFVKKPVDKDELLARLRAASRVLELEKRLSLLARTDPMTGLLTKKVFHEMLVKEWGRSTRHHFPLSCVMFDCDFFKRINDTYGHPVGDEVIRRIGRTLSSNCRGSDVIARFGGEEFAVLLPETTESNAAIWAERIRKLVAADRIMVDGKELAITISGGVAQRMVDNAQPDQLVDMADQALLVAKRSGRDRIVTFSSMLGNTQVHTADTDPITLLKNVPASCVMTAMVATLRQDDKVGSASKFFLRFRINSAPVVDSEGKLVGILSEKDVMSIMLWPQWWNTQIKDVMKQNVVCYDEDTPALSIYEFLCRVTIRAAVIVRDGRPTGLITRGSLLRYFSNLIAISQHADLIPESERTANMPTRTEILAGPPIESRISQTVGCLRHECDDLQQRFDTKGDDLVPCMVGGASRIQELVNDLLSLSREANEVAHVNRAEGENLDSATASGSLMAAIEAMGLATEEVLEESR
ncbi:response regulator receiver modulated diguanylate cyclase [Pirellula staleyi DSM 6068]|uniref:diguanylate cyclase n=1 Tax=Pirellula staleyi (strain ATCC 27377 / DSM 6068 / ICPB 4128) TaxID=530564 RepID=D2QYB7_PIRSD|nr:diguanylate cyclase [Pirellula staleyi]ADB16331.1 response regulator receiver modulated diguanylate cyclase [Pirellula staleyi DSM 6068]